MDSRYLFKIFLAFPDLSIHSNAIFNTLVSIIVNKNEKVGKTDKISFSTSKREKLKLE